MRSFLAALLLTASFAAAADAKKPPAGKAPSGKLKIDLGLGPMNAIPTGEGMETVKEKKAQQPATSTGDAVYSVVRVLHAKAFLRTPDGAKPSAPYEAVATSGNPPVTEKFSTVVRVKCPQKVNTSIDVVVLDPRGDTLMEASGEVFFRGQKDTEVDYTVDWEPTTLTRGTGTHQVLVRLGGAPSGTFPFKIADPPPRK